MILGCVADDFTGASDAASFLQAGGASVILSNGIPERRDEDITRAQAVVIALKTRTCPPCEAVEQSMAAFSWLKAHGARMLYFKYCSTFDSTEKGNIGPVLDAALERWKIPYTLLCPALLENGRSVKDGKLYVNGVLLEESPMKDHPLNPMRDSRLKHLMERQSRYPCYNLDAGELDQDFRPHRDTGHYYLIPDYYEEEHGRIIAGKYGNHPLLSGGSGLLRMIARTWEPDGERQIPTLSFCSAPIILSGSCSQATRTQIRYYESNGGASFRIHPLRFVQGIQTMGHIRAFLEDHKNQTALVYTSAAPDEVKHIRAEWKESYPPLEHYNEDILARTAAYALECGRKRMIAAGGETSGAIMKKLGMHTFHIGRSIAPGVPVMYPAGQEGMELILKSGNFGQEDFFIRAASLPPFPASCEAPW